MKSLVAISRIVALRPRKALDGKQQLMLLRLDVMLLCGGFTEMKELPDLPPELSQIAVLIGGKVAITVHIYIVTRYIWKTLPFSSPLIRHSGVTSAAGAVALCCVFRRVGDLSSGYLAQGVSV